MHHATRNRYSPAIWRRLTLPRTLCRCVANLSSPGLFWGRATVVTPFLLAFATATLLGQAVPTRFHPAQARRLANLAAGRAYAVTFSPDESWLVVAGHDDVVRSFDTTNWQLQPVLPAGQGMVDSLRFSPVRQAWLAASAGNRTIKLWDFAAGRERYELNEHQGLIYDVAFSPDGKLLASAARRANANGDATAEVILWDVANARALRTIDQPDLVFARSIAFSPDGRWLACGGMLRDRPEQAGAVTLWDVGSGKEASTFALASGEITRVVFSPDGRSVAASADQTTRGAVATWGVGSGARQFAIPELPAAALDLAYSPDGRMLAVAVSDMRWRSLAAIASRGDSERFRRAAANFRPGEVCFYDANSGELLGVLPLDMPVHRLAFSPRGLYLVTAGFDVQKDRPDNPSVAVWDLFPVDRYGRQVK